jgi:hypothetical protein
MWLEILLGLVLFVAMWIVGVFLCRLALSLGEQEGFEAGYEHGYFQACAVGRSLEECDDEARRWQAEAQDDWLAT